MTATAENVTLKPGFTQVCVIHGVLVDDVKKFERLFEEHLGAECQYLETIETGPDLDADDKPVPDTGGRSDVFVAIKDIDMGSNFYIDRLRYGIRWIEDVLEPCSYSSPLYPERVFDYCSWDRPRE